MNRKVELLAPGGDIDSIKAAILAGADAVYCGLNKFNARNRAANINFDELLGVLHLAHKHNCEVFLTVNILILESEIPALIKLLNKLVNTTIDGIIIQDLGLFYVLSTYFKSLKIHASTQLTTHNQGQINFLAKLGAQRVNLSRELNLEEIEHLTTFAKSKDVLTEVFVHGSQCVSFSGICYISSVNGGQSGNRGRCSQPCRDKYLTTKMDKQYPLNLKDNLAYLNIDDLYNAGVYSLKIEGRIKKYDYIYTVVSTYKKQINSYLNNHELKRDKEALYKVFNRDFSNAYLTGKVSKDMFIDNPRDNSLIRIKSITNYPQSKETAEKNLLDEKESIKTDVKQKINQINIDKIPLLITVSGENGNSLKLTAKASDLTLELFSDIALSDKGNEVLDSNLIFKRLKAINDSPYNINEINTSDLDEPLFLPFKELTIIKNKLLYHINKGKAQIKPVQLPSLAKPKQNSLTSTLSVIISSIDDLNIGSGTGANIFFQLPSNFKNRLSEFIDIFKQHSYLTPWFPSVLIGEEYSTSLEFIDSISPKSIVTDNSGIAYAAYKKGINWVAGPQLNIANSYSLLSMKENFNCSGAFISPELNKKQIKAIKKPEGFKLFYSLYNPITLMTTRQCLSQQIIKCDKTEIDKNCISHCSKIATITNQKDESFIVEKSKGNYHQVYNNCNFLNTDIILDIPQKFDSFSIDLRNLKNETHVEKSKLELIGMFERAIKGNKEDINELHKCIQPSTNQPYIHGI